MSTEQNGTGGVPNLTLEVFTRSTGGTGKDRPPSGVTAPCPIINIPSSRVPLPPQWKIDDIARAILGGEPADSEELEEARACARDVLDVIDKPAERIPFGAPSGSLVPYEAPKLTPLPWRMPSIELHLVRSVRRPGQLSFRREPTDSGWSEVFEALETAGFKPGDVVRVTKVIG